MSSSNHETVQDLYIIDKSFSVWYYRYYRYINPVIRMLLILPVLYFYAVCSAVLTYRNNTFEATMKQLTGTVPGTDPLPEAKEKHWFILKDLAFDVIAPVTINSEHSWQFFADFSPIFFNIILFLLLIGRRDIIRWTEYIGVQMIMFTGNGIAHVITTIPDSNGLSSACENPEYYKEGSWIYHTLTLEYCGDMM